MSKRLTIGFLASGLSDSFSKSVCQGAMKAANEKDVKLILFPGKYLDRDLTGIKGIQYEYQYNTLFSYAKGNRLDAVLILADSIGCYATAQRIKELVQQYSHIPCVLIASKIDGYVSVNPDNYYGISEAMNYLIHELGMTKIGMIGGPDDNNDARERKETYIRILKENNIPFQEKRFAVGNLSHYTKDVFDRFIDNNPDVQAVFCVNDYTAIGLYDSLKTKHLMPGKDVMVFGYDNMLISSKLKPPLSSVWSDHVQLGETALNTVLQMLDGQKPDNQVLPTKFIRRESFGTVKKQNPPQFDRRLDNHYIDEYFDDIFYRYSSESDSRNSADVRASFQNLMEHIIALYEAGKAADGQTKEILQLFDSFLSNNALDYADTENLLTHVEHIHEAFSQKENAQWQELENTFSAIYRKIILAIEQRSGKMLAEKEDSQFTMKLFVRDIMQFERGTDQSYAVLLEHLDWLDIRNAYIYVFKKPIVHLDHEKLEIPDDLYLKAVLKDGKVESIPSIHQKVNSTDIFLDSNTGEDNTPLVTLPLFSNEMLYGILLCDMTEKLFENGEFLTNQIGTAIKTIELLKANEQIQRQLEESLTALKANNIELDTLSKSDVLTGIMNRRGFYTAGEKLLSQNRINGLRTLIAYVDMNNLKIINDRYGHDEGDFSIKLISSLLTETVADAGIAGRLGGDEFAVMLTASPQEQEKSFVTNIYERFSRYNETSAKPYNVTVSVGTYISEVDDTLTLKQALTLADGKLYEEKQHRTKIVAKNP